MSRIQAIITDPQYQACCEQIRICEENRIFCHHDMTHFLDVARLATIFRYQEQLMISEELIYATALLHDVGRHLQYREGIPHEKASAKIAPQILQRCGFSRKEEAEIVDAIAHHRDKSIKDEASLRGILYRADKMSRSCFACLAQEQCDWSREKKNMELRY